ncbi:VacJ family lipoprotein [Arcobacter sp. s6]|uniref:VacJ family lipoprotein n=1 Tax=Arcobacter sp. s6 TaxID=3230363 RepID=UPI0034A00571
MKKIILLITLTIFCFAEDKNKNDFAHGFDLEYNKNKIEVFDPLSGYNRLMTTFNDKIYMNVLDPAARGYEFIVPQTVRIGFDNFFKNLMFPVRFANNVLQLKFKNSAEELGRFLVNTIWGLAGFMDVAKSELKWEAHNEDFGQTLGFYGVGDGFHVVLPFLGPSNLRDIVGIGADSYVSVLSTTGSSDLNYKIPDTFLQQMGIATFNIVNTTSLKLGQYESIKKDALDLYPFLRDVYTQARKKQIEE